MFRDNSNNSGFARPVRNTRNSYSSNNYAASNNYGAPNNYAASNRYAAPRRNEEPRQNTYRPYGESYEEPYQEGYEDNYSDYNENRVQEAARMAPPDDEAIIEEIERIKAETRSLRQLLADRKIQVDRVEESLTKVQAENNAMILKVANAIGDLSGQMEEMEEALRTSIENNNKSIAEEVAKANKPITTEFNNVKDEINKSLDRVVVEIGDATDKVNGMYGTIGEMKETLEEKADRKLVTSLHQRMTTMFAVGVANVVGTMLTLGLICYLIMSLAR